MKSIIEEYGGMILASILSLTVIGIFVEILNYVTSF